MQPETQGKIFGLLLIELEKAEKKHPEFMKFDAPQVILEELGELAHAYNDYAESRISILDLNEKIKEEAAHVAVTAIRLLGRVLQGE